MQSGLSYSAIQENRNEGIRMKLSDGFDARRLRNRDTPNWRWRCACLCVAVLILGGLALAGLGAFALFSGLAALEELHASPAASVGTLLAGLLLTGFGLLLRRRSRRRHLQGASLSLAPHLLRKHG